MITGFNTDVEHNGVTYHVQTEDKGLQTPVILSLVYAGGAILASKRSPYDDLIASGFNQNVLAERLERQHKLICAAVHAGRIEELKRMAERVDAPQETLTPTAVLHPESSALAEPVSGSPPQPPVAESERFSISEDSENALVVTLVDEKQLRAGESVTLRIQVMKQSDRGPTAAAKANVSVKVLGSTFQPSSTYSTTDSAGRSAISITLPAFKTGRAAVLIRVEADGEVAELRRIIQPG